MKAVAYFRVSTAAQGRSGLGLDAQQIAVHELATSRGLDILQTFTEVETGKRNDRPELTKALHHTKLTGAVLVIAKLDRLSRNAAFLLALRESGVRFIAADIPDANDLTIGVLAIIAQAEREAISRRTKEALDVVRQRLSSGTTHVSTRSGRAISRLGNPHGAAALRRAGQGNSKGIAAAKQMADRRANDLRQVVLDLQTGGIKTAYGLSQAMNDQGILTPRQRRWHPSSVCNLLKRLTSSTSESSILVSNQPVPHV